MKKNINVPLFDLLSQYKSISRDINSAAAMVLNSGFYILGTEVSNFEKDLSYYIGTKYVIGMSSGTDALTIAIKSLGLGKGDEVIMPANVYPTAFGVSLAGVQVRLCDVDPRTLNIDLQNIQKKITSKTKAIVAVHLYGNPVDLDPIKQFIRRRKIFLIEDCAQAGGATYKDKKVGSFGDASCFSFYPTKNLGACGDAGAILTNRKKLRDKIILWRTYGEKKRYESVLVGQNSRMDEIQAAILRVKLKNLDKWNVQRRKIAETYTKGLKDTPLELTEETPSSKAVYHLFTVRTKRRKELIEYLKAANISTGVHYPVPVHLVPSFKQLGYKRGDFPICEKASKKILSLPIYPEMSRSSAEYVVKKIKSFFENRRQPKKI